MFLFLVACCFAFFWVVSVVSCCNCGPFFHMCACQMTRTCTTHERPIFAAKEKKTGLTFTVNTVYLLHSGLFVVAIQFGNFWSGVDAQPWNVKFVRNKNKSKRKTQQKPR